MSDETATEGTAVAAPVSAAQLRSEAARARAVAEELTRQAAEMAVAEEEARKPKMPSVQDGPAFVAFSRYLNGREYAFAAVGWRSGRSVRWAVTGAEDRRFNWPGLLQFVGEANWPTLRVLVDGDSLCPEGFEPPVAEDIGSFGRVLGTSDPADHGGVVAILTAESPFARGGEVRGYGRGGVYPPSAGPRVGRSSAFGGPGLYRDGDDPYGPGSQR